MKQLGIASFTINGSRVADELAAAFDVEYEIVRYEKGLKDWCSGLFAAHADGIIFVGACGIAVRTIAPFLVSKMTDPAVLVIDEKGQFVISLLSGHIGGANRLALRAAEVLGATPVITTATDVNGKFAVDVFASDNHLRIEGMRLAKEISAAILRGEKVGVYCEGEMEGVIPPELTLIGSRLWSGWLPDSSGEPGLETAGATEAAPAKTRAALENRSAVGGTAVETAGATEAAPARTRAASENRSAVGGTAEDRPMDAMICIGVPSCSFGFVEKRKDIRDSSFLMERIIDIWVSSLRAPILYLIPKAYVLGIGCRKGKSEAAIARAVEQATSSLGILPEDVVGVASIDLKKDEPGLVKFCQKRNLRFCTFPAEMLAEVRGVFSGSSFVQSVTGVDNVCERAALCLAKLLSEPPGALADTSLDGEEEDNDTTKDDHQKHDVDLAEAQQNCDDEKKYAFLKKASCESGRLILGKQAIDGVTVAVAERRWSVRF